MKIRALKKRRGITLIELMVVLVIVGTLMSILFVTIRDPQRDAMTQRMQYIAARGQLDSAIFLFRDRFGRIPTTDEGLEALVEAPPGIDKPYPSGGFLTNKSILLDPWKKPYQYEAESASNYRIYTYGADGEPGGEGENADVNLHEVE